MLKNPVTIQERGSCHYTHLFLAACVPRFVTFASEGVRPLGVSKLSVGAHRNRDATKTKGLGLTSTRNWWSVFTPRLILGPVMAGQRLFFWESRRFLNFTRL